MKKLLAVTVMILFISVSIIPSTGSLLSFDDVTPPVTTHSLNPPEPDGENGYYVSDLEVTLNATDNESGVKEIRYRVNGGFGGKWRNISGNKGTFLVGVDGNNVPVEYYAIDNSGNEEDIILFTVDMDQTYPNIDNVWVGTYEKDGWWYVRFYCYGIDETSGMDRVEFFINNGHQETIESDGPDYVFTIQWSETLRNHRFWFYHYDKAGNMMICNASTHPIHSLGTIIIGLIHNPEISVHNITFFAVAVLVFTGSDFCCGGYSLSFVGIGRSFTYLNNYDGFIGKHFIRATFYNWDPE